MINKKYFQILWFLHFVLCHISSHEQWFSLLPPDLEFSIKVVTWLQFLFAMHLLNVVKYTLSTFWNLTWFILVHQYCHTYTFPSRWKIPAAKNSYILLTKKRGLIVLRVEGIVDFEIRILIWVNWNLGNSKWVPVIHFEILKIKLPSGWEAGEIMDKEWRESGTFGSFLREIEIISFLVRGGERNSLKTKKLELWWSLW